MKTPKEDERFREMTLGEILALMDERGMGMFGSEDWKNMTINEAFINLAALMSEQKINLEEMKKLPMESVEAKLFHAGYTLGSLLQLHEAIDAVFLAMKKETMN